jgi:hypothetical protein
VPTVRVLLAVHEGEQYIDEQAGSLAAQVGCDVDVEYHLDSVDAGAQQLLLDRLPGARRVPLAPGLGVPRAYIELIRCTDTDADLFAFADQDDVWAPGKVSAAAAALAEQAGRPALWVSRIRPFSDEPTGRTYRPVHPATRPQPSFGNALVETIAPGCTMVWNRELQARVRERLPGPGVLMHDSWMYLVASAIGVVLVDDRPTVDYRIHARNAVGLSAGVLDRARRFARLRSDPSLPSMATQADELVRAYGDLLTPRQLELAEALTRSRRGTLAEAWLRGDLRRRSRADNALLLPRLLLGPDAGPPPAPWPA